MILAVLGYRYGKHLVTISRNLYFAKIYFVEIRNDFLPNGLNRHAPLETNKTKFVICDSILDTRYSKLETRHPTLIPQKQRRNRPVLMCITNRLRKKLG
jgi:hypothetical protein